MPKPNSQESPLFNIASGACGLALVFCAFEMVPGWGFLHLNWPSEAYYTIMLVTGAIAGVARDPRYLAAGLAGGAGAGFGALFALGMSLARVQVANKLGVLLVAAVGATPGVGLYILLKWAQDMMFHPEDEGANRPPDSGRRSA